MATSLFSGDVLVIAAGALLFIAIVLAAFALGGRSMDAEMAEDAEQNPADAQSPQLSIEDNILSRIGRFVTPTNNEELGEARLRMARAGFRRPSAVRIFYLGRSIFGLGIAFIASALFPFMFQETPLPIVIALLFGVLILGFLIPSMVLDRMIADRRRKAEQGFPDVLDMLLVCIEAGQGFEQATRRIARELAGHNDVLAEELTILNNELWAGRDRNLAFRDFALRLNVEDITAFVTVVRQSEQFGVSIADAIRVFAFDMRHKRVMRAEEKANLMPMKLALASMVFTVPPVIMIMIGPAILDIIQSFSG